MGNFHGVQTSAFLLTDLHATAKVKTMKISTCIQGVRSECKWHDKKGLKISSGVYRDFLHFIHDAAI